MVARADADFWDYLEKKEVVAANAARRDEMIAQHQDWLDTTWAGFATTKLLSLGSLPFITAISEALQDQEDGKSTSAMVVANFVRIAVVFAVILAVYIIGKIVQIIIGGDIEIIDEVVIIKEVPRSKVGNEKNDTKEVIGRQNKKKN